VNTPHEKLPAMDPKELGKVVPPPALPPPQSLPPLTPVKVNYMTPDDWQNMVANMQAMQNKPPMNLGNNGAPTSVPSNMMSPMPNAPMFYMSRSGTLLQVPMPNAFYMPPPMNMMPQMPGIYAQPTQAGQMQPGGFAGPRTPIVPSAQPTNGNGEAKKASTSPEPAKTSSKSVKKPPPQVINIDDDDDEAQPTQAAKPSVDDLMLKEALGK